MASMQGNVRSRSGGAWLDRRALFGGKSRQLRLPLAARGSPEEVPAGSVLFRRDEPVQALYQVRTGLVKLVTYLETGQARIVRLQRRHDWLGLEGLVKQPHAHTAIAVNRVEVDRYPVDGLGEFLDEDPAILRRVLSQWHADLRKADRWIADFSTGPIRRRVLRLVEYLADLRDSAAGPDAVKLMTVQEMGEILGVTPESVSRVLAGLKRSGLLRQMDHRSREVFHVDRSKLAQLSRRR